MVSKEAAVVPVPGRCCHLRERDSGPLTPSNPPFLQAMELHADGQPCPPWHGWGAWCPVALSARPPQSSTAVTGDLSSRVQLSSACTGFCAFHNLLPSWRRTFVPRSALLFLSALAGSAGDSKHTCKLLLVETPSSLLQVAGECPGATEKRGSVVLPGSRNAGEVCTSSLIFNSIYRRASTLACSEQFAGSSRKAAVSRWLLYLCCNNAPGLDEVFRVSRKQP